MFRHANTPRRRPFSPLRGTTALLAAALVGLPATGAAWSASAAAPHTCAVSDLHLSMGRKEGAAGSLYWPVRFTNTSTASCALRGYPGVSVLDAAHHRLGPAATRSGSPAATVTLAPGRSAAAVLRTTNGPLGGPCLRTGSYLSVYPPASRTAVLIPAPWRICSGLFEVGPVNTEGTI